MSFDLSNIDVNINGHEVSGFSDDTDALLLPDLEIASVKRGADGKMIAAGTGNKGGPVSLKLLANSKSCAFFSGLATVQKGTGVFVQLNGLVRYNNTGITVALVNGKITSYPSGPTVGKGDVASQVFVIEFEQIIPDYSAASL